MLSSIAGFILGLFYSTGNVATPPTPDYVAPVVMVESSNGWHGSGVFITPTKVLTVKHVANDIVKVDDDGNRPVITIRAEDGNIYHEVSYVDDTDVDVAVITVDRPYTGPLPKLNCLPLNRGQELITVGNPGQDEFVQEVLYFTGGHPGKDTPKEVLEMFHGVYLFQGPAIGGLSGAPIYTLWGDIVGLLDLQEADSDGRDGLGGFVGMTDVCQFVKNQM